MSPRQPALPAVDEVRQANRLFLEFLRSRARARNEDFGLSQRVIDMVAGASAEQIEQAAAFPRALFRLKLPPWQPGAVLDAGELSAAPDRRVLQVAILQCVWTLCRMSGYAARLLLRLDDHAIDRLRHAELGDILHLSLANDILHAAFEELDWVWQELLSEVRPERRRSLLLLGLQPEPVLRPSSA